MQKSFGISMKIAEVDNGSILNLKDVEGFELLCQPPSEPYSPSVASNENFEAGVNFIGQ